MTKSNVQSLDKPALRAELKRERAALSVNVWTERSRAIVSHVERYLDSHPARRVALFAPSEPRREVDVRPLDVWLRARGTAIAYPVMRSDAMGFAWANLPSDAHQARTFWQPEPTSELLLPGELDVVLVPALAATSEGFRLGYGAGYYDRALSSFCPPARSICVVFELQLRANLPLADHDVACDVVITENGVVGAT